MVRAAFRVDASPRIGIGHAMRCLTLARLIARETDADIRFICNRDLPDGVLRQLADAGFGLGFAGDSDGFDWRTDAALVLDMCAEERPDWIVVDHYGIDRRWEEMIRPAAGRLLVIDDLADRQHDCDALLDQNLAEAMEQRYRGLVPDGCRLFLGPGFALLREEFIAARDLAVERTKLNQVLINFGGSDPTGEAFKALNALETQGWPAGPEGIQVHVVAGPANPRSAELAERCRSLPNVSFYPEVREMARLLAEMDLAVGAGGISLWERSFMGVPSAVIAVAGNQIPSSEEAARRGMIWYLGESGAVTPSDIGGLLRHIAEHPEELCRKSRQSLREMRKLREVSGHPVVNHMLEASRTERGF